MSTRTPLAFVPVLWIAVVLVSLAARNALISVPLTLTEALGWLFVGSVPIGIVLTLFRGAPSTVTNVLYNVEHPVPAADALPRQESRGARS